MQPIGMWLLQDQGTLQRVIGGQYLQQIEEFIAILTVCQLTSLLGLQFTVRFYRYNRRHLNYFRDN